MLMHSLIEIRLISTIQAYEELNYTLTWLEQVKQMSVAKPYAYNRPCRAVRAHFVL